MIDIVSNNSSTGYVAPTSDAEQASLDYDAFLQLLVAELKNQDPTEPMDSSEYVAQLASFSNVEQSIKTNDQLKQMLETSLVEQASSIVGMNLTSADGEIEGTVESVAIYSDGLIATLDSGEEVLIGPGVTISNDSD
ncbi:MAG: flagellar hook assembly protein FlgD [Pseudomonadota bacterium]